MRKLEAFFAAMIAVMAGSFAVMYARADVPTAQVGYCATFWCVDFYLCVVYMEALFSALSH